MPAFSSLAKKIISAIKKHRQVIATLLVLAVMGLAVWTWYLWRVLFTLAPNEVTAGEEPAISDLVRRPLDGRWVKPELATTTLAAVVIDNAPEARPQSGLTVAPLVWEAPVEGGRTRFLAVFPLSRDVLQYVPTLDNLTIGPVRSARPYFLDWAKGLNALFTHVGGSDQALADIKTDNIFDLNEYYRGSYFWRDRNRPRPSNVYTTVANLTAAAAKESGPQGWQAQDLLGWLFKDKKAPLSVSSRPAVDAWIEYSDEPRVVWKFNTENNIYERWLDDKRQCEKEVGACVAADNVVFVLITSEVLDDVGRLKLKTSGEGKAILMRDGIIMEGSWRKDSLSEQLQFFDKDGKAMVFNAGNTWLEVIDQSTAYSYQ